MHSPQNTSGPKKLGSIGVSIISGVGDGGLCAICKEPFHDPKRQIAVFETGGYTGPSNPELIALYGAASHLDCLAASLGGQKIISDSLNVASVVTSNEAWIEFGFPNSRARIPAVNGPQLSYKITVAAGFATADYTGLKFLEAYGCTKEQIITILTAAREERKQVLESNAGEGMSYSEAMGLAFGVFLAQMKKHAGIEASSYLDWQSSQSIQ